MVPKRMNVRGHFRLLVGNVLHARHSHQRGSPEADIDLSVARD